MPDRLSARELQCLRLTATMTDKEIARALSLSPKTVSHHVSGAMRKLGSGSRREALRRLGEKPLGMTTPILHTDAAGLYRETDRNASGPETETGTRRLPAPPRSWNMKTALIGLFAFVAALIALGAVTMVTGLFDLVSVHAPSTAL